MNLEHTSEVEAKVSACSPAATWGRGFGPGLTCCDRSPILVPLHLHGGVADGGQLRLEVGVATLLQLPEVVEWPDEFGPLGRQVVGALGALVPGVVLQLLDLLEAVGVLA